MNSKAYKIAAVTALAVAGFAVAGIASGQEFPGQTTAQQERPRNVDPPRISGTPIVGRFVTGHRGEWTNDPDRFVFSWLRCDRDGGSCAAISGATERTYRVTSADVGNTLRFRVRAENEAGATTATSVPSAVARAAQTQPPPPPAAPPSGTGCPAGNANPDPVTTISPPARLTVDRVESQPGVIPGSARSFTVRVHVTSSCGGDVQGALVYATAVPFNMVSIPPETATGSDGWVELRFNDINFPISPRQQLLVLFVRARKPGESLLGGISTRRLVSVRVNARG